MGKSTISMAIFNSFFYVYQAGYHLPKLIFANLLPGQRLVPHPPHPANIVEPQTLHSDTQKERRMARAATW
jgi:hypothetical protein